MENRKLIPSAGPSITDLEVKFVTEAVKYGWYEERNMHTNQLIEEIKSYTGMKYCLPTVNCTSAIHLALLSLGIGPGNEVIVPDITWVASACPICYVGAKPVFVDIDRKSWCISPDAFEKAINKKTKAVIVVGLYGNMPDMERIVEIAGRYDIPIIEDSAEVLGAEYKNKKAGTFGTVGVYSFNATKLAMAGQGGILITNNEDIYNKSKQLSHHGMLGYSEKMFWSEEIGYNYQWTNIQAALALAQMKRIEELLEKKMQVFKWYKGRLRCLDGIQLNPEEEHIKNTYWVVTGIMDKKYNLEKEEVIKEFKKHGIDSRPFFYPISSMPAYSKYVENKNMKEINPVSYDVSSRGISFPSSFTLTEEEVEYTCDIFKDMLPNNPKIIDMGCKA